MKKVFLFLVLLSTNYYLLATDISAESRNIFGLHLTQTSDISSAAPIINSSGGQWGYVTIVIRLDQLDQNTWQSFFDRCRELHLIPIIRLATLMLSDGTWQQPQISDIDNLANFLNSLNWPSQTQHIILFNEINHASEWGGQVDLKSYTDISLYATKKFKQLNPNFFVLGAGLDLAAPESPPQFKSASNVYREIYLYQPDYFQTIDGLASHSYPNHGFIGTPNDSGQHSILGFEWELDYIKNLGVNRTFPIFITETGWPHREGESNDNRFYTCQTSAQFLTQAFQKWSQNQSIVAVTPFIYNYPHPPFDHFSWLNSREKLFPEYQVLIDLPKNQNHPIQITSFKHQKISLPFLILSGREYTGEITLKNTGQSIWGESPFCLKPQSPANITLDSLCTNFIVRPNQSHAFAFKFKVDSTQTIENTYLSWDNLPKFDITPIDPSGFLYHPKTGINNTIRSFLNRLLSR